MPNTGRPIEACPDPPNRQVRSMECRIVASRADQPPSLLPLAAAAAAAAGATVCLAAGHLALILQALTSSRSLASANSTGARHGGGGCLHAAGGPGPGM